MSALKLTQRFPAIKMSSARCPTLGRVAIVAKVGLGSGYRCGGDAFICSDVSRSRWRSVRTTMMSASRYITCVHVRRGWCVTWCTQVCERGAHHVIMLITCGSQVLISSRAHHVLITCWALRNAHTFPRSGSKATRRETYNLAKLSGESRSPTCAGSGVMRTETSTCMWKLPHTVCLLDGYIPMFERLRVPTRVS